MNFGTLESVWCCLAAIQYLKIGFQMFAFVLEILAPPGALQFNIHRLKIMISMFVHLGRLEWYVLKMLIMQFPADGETAWR